MTKKDEINSTEKLLDLIRGKGKKPVASGSLPGSPKPGGMRKPKRLSKPKPVRRRKPLLAMGRRKVVGIDICKTQLNLVEVAYLSEKKPVVTNYQEVPYDDEVSVNHQRFPAFLKSALNQFCGGQRNTEFWTAIPSLNVETRYLRIPKVSKKQVANAVFWTFRKESSFNEKDSIFDFSVLGETTEEGVPRLEVVASSAPKQDVEIIRKAFLKSGYPLNGITTVPFALQNLFKTSWASSAGDNVCTVFIGKDWARIAIFSKGNIVLLRDIKTGLSSMAEAIADGLEKKEQEGVISPAWDEGESLTLEALERQDVSDFTEKAGEILGDFLNGRIRDKVLEYDVEEDEVFSWIIPPLDRVVRQVERTLDHFYLNVENERVKNIYISGPLSAMDRVVSYVSAQLGLPIDLLDPFSPATPDSVSVGVPDSAVKRDSFVPAFGLALSSNVQTPNLIYTYSDKNKAEKLTRFNRAIFSCAIALMVACSFVFIWQNRQLAEKRQISRRLAGELESFIPRVDQNMILQLMSESVGKQQGVQSYADKYECLAVIGEIVEIIPPNIRLSNLKIDFGPKPDSESTKEGKIVILDGVIIGDRLQFESALAGFMVKLENSPMFSVPELLQQNFEFMADKEVLTFKARAGVI